MALLTGLVKISSIPRTGERKRYLVMSDVLYLMTSTSCSTTDYSQGLTRRFTKYGGSTARRTVRQSIVMLSITTLKRRGTTARWRVQRGLILGYVTIH